MHNVEALNAFLKRLEEIGYTQIEIYAEHHATAAFTVRAKIEDVRYTSRKGVALRALKDGVAQQVFAPSLEELFARFEFAPDALPTLGAAVRPALGESVTAALLALRAAFSIQNEKFQGALAHGVFSAREYWVFHPDRPPARGTEEEARLSADWEIAGASEPFTWERGRATHAALLADLGAEDGVSAAIRKSLHSATLWPAPGGNLPVLWSARVVARLQTLFLQAFEGDRLLDCASFLAQQPLPLSLAFSIEDQSPHGQHDHEGHARKTTYLLKSGRPTALACNRRVAGLLEVEPTGHARRQSYDSPATLGFWHACVEGENAEDGLLERMEKGLLVQDLEVLAYDPGTGRARLRLSDSRLVHHGQPGEAVEPLELTLAVVELLQSFKRFEKTKRTTGVLVAKNNQSLLTEISAPAALSEGLLLPGSVPPENYW